MEKHTACLSWPTTWDARSSLEKEGALHFLGGSAHTQWLSDAFGPKEQGTQVPRGT